MNTTDAQRAAIESDGNVLVAAGAGAGKTSTLVERCVQRLVDPKYRAQIGDILMVTFTEAAAAEMRARVRARLERVIAETKGTEAEATGLRDHAEEQLGLLDSANISTLHSFCFRLVREHFHALGIDPQLAILTEAEARVLMDETLDALFHKYYLDGEGKGPLAERVQELIQVYGLGKEEPIRAVIRRIHEYSQTVVDPEQWLNAQRSHFSDTQPNQWRIWLMQALQKWREEWRARLREAGNLGSMRSVTALEAPANTLADFGILLQKIPPPADFEKADRPEEQFTKEVSFLRSVTVHSNGRDPLEDDWAWIREEMLTLLELAAEFGKAYAARKREQGAVDFPDLEQLSLRLLRDAKTGAPTPLARECQGRFRFVFVDECQDINASQDAILRAVSRDREANRFLVGDVKQSIYRFRLADPRIFQEYEKRWAQPECGAKVIPLRENFRSRESLIDFFNAVFSELMVPELGGVEFDENAELRFGAPQERSALAKSASDGPRVHVHLRLTSKDKEAEDGDSDTAEMSSREHEARIVANALHELRSANHAVWDGTQFRPMVWSDVAVLLRAPGEKAEAYAREFARQHIPMEAAQESFFEALEIRDLLNVITILDNPLQDVPLIAVLHSPIGGLTPDELALVRLAARKESFWVALKQFHGARKESDAWRKADRFLDRFNRWRRMGRDASLSARLQAILNETCYMDWLAAQTDNPERAAQSLANVRRLLTLAEQFDPFQRQGLSRFLRYVEAQQQVPSREPVTARGNAVQLISIHRSKGLEYPIVVVPDLGKQFNLADLGANIRLDSTYGLCAKVRAPGTGQLYPSVAHWLSARAERAELLGEEMRLLYVAMTRARDTLLLVGTAARSTAEKWGEATGSPRELLRGKSMLAWLGPWLARHAGTAHWLKNEGIAPLFTWRTYGNESEEAAVQRDSRGLPAGMEIPADLEALCARLTAPYAHALAAQEAAKTTVSLLRRKMRDPDEEAKPWIRRMDFQHPTRDGLSAAEIGVAHHTFLEFAELAKLTSAGAVQAEAERLVAAGSLTEEEAGQLNGEALARFWNGELGKKILSAPDVRRELAFTARFDCGELGQLGLGKAEAPAGEFIVVQGVIDVAVLWRDEIWLLDFKTDEVNERTVEDKKEEYRTQLAAYGAAMERMYPGRKVTHRWLHFLASGETVEVS